MDKQEIEWIPGVAVYAESGIIEHYETGELMAYIEISNLEQSGETQVLRMGMSTQDGLWFGLNVLRKTLRVVAIKVGRKVRRK